MEASSTYRKTGLLGGRAKKGRLRESLCQGMAASGHIFNAKKREVRISSGWSFKQDSTKNPLLA